MIEGCWCPSVGSLVVGDMSPHRGSDGTGFVDGFSRVDNPAACFGIPLNAAADSADGAFFRTVCNRGAGHVGTILTWCC